MVGFKEVDRVDWGSSQSKRLCRIINVSLEHSKEVQKMAKWCTMKW